MLLRSIICSLALAVLGLGFASHASAIGGNYVIAGGTNMEQLQVRRALNASSFNWSLVPQQITIRIAPRLPSEASPGEISLDAQLLDSGIFSWGIVQHEYAHQVDFFLLDNTTRALLETQLGGTDWCYGVLGLAHSSYGCERFASTLAWAYWPSPQNSMKPSSAKDESAAMAPASFRVLLARLIGAPVNPPSRTVAYAPPAKIKKK